MKLVDETTWLNSLLDPSVHFRFVQYVHRNERTAWAGRTNRYPRNMLVYAEKGTLDAVAADEQFRVDQDCLLWLPPGTLKLFSCAAPLRNHRIHIVLGPQEKQLCPVEKPTLRRCSPEVRQYYLRLHTVFRSHIRAKESLIRSLLALISDAFFNGSEPRTKGVRALDAHQQRKIEDVLRKYIASPLTGADLARELRLTHDYFSRVFRKTYGMPPRRFIKEERMRTAANFLTDSMLSVKEVAHRVGINDLPLFCRQFKTYYGQTPTEFRNEAG